MERINPIELVGLNVADMPTKVTINVGLNNNPYDAVDVVVGLESFANAVGFSVKCDIKDGEYNGVSEPTVIAQFKNETGFFNISDESFWRGICEALCIDFTQECIPFKIEGFGLVRAELVYNPMYEGEKYEFSDEYFINL